MDGVVNNAAETPAYKRIQAALEFPKDELELFQRVNVLGTINVIQSTGKKMVAAGNGGSIVNISRYANEIVLLGMQIYCNTRKDTRKLYIQRPNTKLPHTIRATINKESTTKDIPSQNGQHRQLLREREGVGFYAFYWRQIRPVFCYC